LLPAWLGYPGKQKPTPFELVCTFCLTFATFKALSKNNLNKNYHFDFRWLDFKDKREIFLERVNQVEPLVE
jgi:hypothetical protein